MAELKDVVESILSDLIAVRHSANKYSRALSQEYLAEGELSRFSIPSVDLDRVSIDIKFALADPDGEPAGTNIKLKRDEISRIIRESAVKILDQPSVMFRESSARSADRNAVYENIARLINSNTDPVSLKINKDRALDPSVEILRPHLAREDSTRPVTVTATRSLVNRVIADSERKLSIALDDAKKAAAVKPNYVFDYKTLKAMDPALIATLSLDLDMPEIEWHEIEQD